MEQADDVCSTQTYESLEEGCDLSPDACDRPGQPFMTLVLEPGQRVVLFPLLPRTGAWVARPQSEPEAIECATDQGAEAHDMMTSWQISPRPQTDGADPKARKRNRETMQADEFVSRLREWQKRIPSVQPLPNPVTAKKPKTDKKKLNAHVIYLAGQAALSKAPRLAWEDAKRNLTVLLKGAASAVQELQQQCDYHKFLKIGELLGTWKAANRNITNAATLEDLRRLCNERFYWACKSAVLHFNQGLECNVRDLEAWAALQTQLTERLCAVGYLMDCPESVTRPLLYVVEIGTPGDRFAANRLRAPAEDCIALCARGDEGHGPDRAFNLPLFAAMPPEGLALDVRLPLVVVMPVWDGCELLSLLLQHPQVLLKMASSEALRYHAEHHGSVRRIEIYLPCMGPACRLFHPHEHVARPDEDNEREKEEEWVNGVFEDRLGY